MTKTTSTFELHPENNARLLALCGELNCHIGQIEKHLSIDITERGNLFALSGEKSNIETGERVLRQLYKETRHNNSVTEESVFMAISNHVNHSSKPDENTSMTDEPSNTLISDTPMPTPQAKAKDKPESMAQNYAQREYNHAVLNTPKMKVIGKNPSQRHYIGQMLFHDISFGIGPAGTGKTYLAVACAVHALTQHEIQRIILVRPAVEAGERLGFLPGDIGQKVDPYLRPLYDALYDMLGFDKVAKLIEKNVIEIAPLAYMRGRTLNDAAVILDEAQNTTIEQMKMFLTRVGFGSKAMITGDLTQIDLPKHMKSGLRHAAEVLENVDDIGFSYFSPDDVVRHPLVQRIVKAYEIYDKQEQAAAKHQGVNQ